MRDTNKYFSEKFDSVIPCYKEKPNKCKELKEFDYEKENEYQGTLLENSETYITYYQIDKSSESYLVNCYLEFHLVEPINEFFSLFLNFYLEDKLSELMNLLKLIWI